MKKIAFFNLKEMITLFVFIGLVPFLWGHICFGQQGSKQLHRGLYLKIHGGANFLDGGDFNDMIDINKIHYEKVKSPTTRSPFFWDLGGEIGYSWGKFSFGIETGYIKRSFKVEDPINSSVRTTGYHTWRFSALPVLLNLHFKALDVSLLKVNISLGSGIYFGKFKEDGDLRYRSSQFSWIEEAKDNSVGFHVGISADFFISNKLSLFIEARYRLVNFTNIDGKGDSVSTYMGTENYEGDLYFERDKSTGPVFFNIGALDGLQKAEINLRGLALNLGIKLNL